MTDRMTETDGRQYLVSLADLVVGASLHRLARCNFRSYSTPLSSHSNVVYTSISGDADAASLACRVRPSLSPPNKREERGERGRGGRRTDTSTLRIPFHNAEQAAAGKRALDVDREVNMDLVERVTSLEGEVLVV